MRGNRNDIEEATLSYTLITGGAQNIGKATALHLASLGKSICIHYFKSKADAQELVKEIECRGGEAISVQGDFSSPKSVNEFIEKLPPIKEIVHNVGNYLVKSPLETSSADLRSLFETNFFAPYQITEALLPHLTTQRGRIVLLGIAGIHTARVDSMAYHLTKQCMYMWMRAISKKIAKEGVTVNMVSPGYAENSEVESEKLPMQRTATFEEIAKGIAYFLSDDASYITGQNLEIAGGVRL